MEPADRSAPDPPDVCDICRFDSRRWSLPDTIGSLRSFGTRWLHTIADVDDELLQHRPDDATWSIAEYTDHVRSSTWVMRFVVELTQGDPGARFDDLEPEPAGPHRRVQMVIALDQFSEELLVLHDLARRLDHADLEAAVVIGGASRSARWALLHLTHDLTHHLHDIGRIRHRLGVGAPSATGSVAQVNSSSGGVPKRPLTKADVDSAGIVGDVQADRKHHGRPWQALCLWSTDVIEALRAEGHPIEAGAAGENLSLEGLDWPTLRPGTRIGIGSMTCEVSSYAEPCAKNARWFSDGDVGRMNHDQHPGWSRLYAAVVQPGTVAPGDEVRVEPAP